MDPLKIKGSRILPFVSFDAENGLLEMGGISVPADSIEFYRPLLEWFGEYAKNPKPVTRMNFRFEYYNTNSLKCLFDFFKRLEKFHLDGNNIIVNWYYDEDYEDLLESGEDFRTLLKVPIQIIPCTK